MAQNTAGVALSATYTAAEAGCASGGQCSVTPTTALSNNTAFSWFVRAITAAGAGAWNSGTSMYVSAVGAAGPPVAPLLVSPSGTAGSTTPTYAWNAVAGATTYGIIVQNTAGVAFYSPYLVSDVGCASGTGICTITPAAPLTNGTAYSWFVAAGNGYGYGSWSAGLSFTVNVVATTSPPAAPTPIAPSGSAGSTTPTYSWLAATGASEYYLLVQNTSGVAVGRVVTASEAGCSVSGTCSFTPAAMLTAGATYVWFVNASNTYGTSAWSTGTPITVPAPIAPVPPVAPTLVSPNGNLGTTSPMFTWNAVPGADAYYLLVQNTAGVAVGRWYNATELGCGAGSGLCSVTPTVSLSSATTYAWFVAAWNVYGTSPWSAGNTIRTP